MCTRLFNLVLFILLATWMNEQMNEWMNEKKEDRKAQMLVSTGLDKLWYSLAVKNHTTLKSNDKYHYGEVK